MGALSPCPGSILLNTQLCVEESLGTTLGEEERRVVGGGGWEVEGGWGVEGGREKESIP